MSEPKDKGWKCTCDGFDVCTACYMTMANTGKVFSSEPKPAKPPQTEATPVECLRTGCEQTRAQLAAANERAEKAERERDVASREAHVHKFACDAAIKAKEEAELESLRRHVECGDRIQAERKRADDLSDACKEWADSSEIERSKKEEAQHEAAVLRDQLRKLGVEPCV